MKKKVVLVKPKNIYAYSAYPPLELLTVGAVLHENGYEVKIINAAAQENYKKLLLEECKNALIVGVTGYTSEVKSAIEITDFVKENSNVPVVWGGWHATLFPVQTCMDRNVDFVIINEGDYSMLKLVKNLEGKGQLKEIPGLVYKENGKAVMAAPCDYVNIEKLPLVKYDLVDISRYSTAKLTDYFGRKKSVWLPYQSSRGCPHRCTFCINTVTGNNVMRMKSPKKVMSEVKTLIEKHGLTHLRIIDDNFFANRKRVKEICEGFIKNKFDITWDAECRVDYFREEHLDDELLGLCTKSGLIELTLGCESGSQRLLDLMKKDIKVEQSIHCVKQCHTHKIIPRCSFMVGIPTETKEEILMTAKLINELKKIEPEMAYGVATFRPYPRSEMCDDLVEKGVFREPKTLREWATKRYVQYYTERTHKQPWQTHPTLAQNMGFYYTLASGILLSNQQIKSKRIRKVNSFFIKLGQWRTENWYFKFPIDKYIYDFFYRAYFKWDTYKKSKAKGENA